MGLVITTVRAINLQMEANTLQLATEVCAWTVENTAVRDRSTVWLVTPSGPSYCPSLFNLAAGNESNWTRVAAVAVRCVLTVCCTTQHRTVQQ